MNIAALVPFAVLFTGFVGLRLPLTIASWIALLTSCLLTQTVFHASGLVWQVSLTKSLEVVVEIGGILIGGFFFLETAKKFGVIDSLAHLVKGVSPNRIVQGMLVVFPLELLVEGSSGFGTPLLVIAPLLVALHFDIALCALLPFLVVFIGIPFGALGTPLRLGFPHEDISIQTVNALAPMMFIAPLLTSFLIAKAFRWKESLWVISLSTVFYIGARLCAPHGPEFATLIPAFVTFVYGAISANLFFGSRTLNFQREKKGVLVYGALILFMAVGKYVFLDDLIPGTHIRIFNPGIVFLLFGIVLNALVHKTPATTMIRDTFERSRRTIVVLFCITWIVQQLRENGGLTTLAASLPESFLGGSGIVPLTWLGTSMIGNSTMTNLLFSKIVDPAYFGVVAAATSIGTQLGFQAIVAIRSALHEKISESKIFLQIFPWTAGYIFLLWILSIAR